MDENMDKNLSTLKEMLLDEERLITYISLSKELCVHVNDSKSLLSKIVQLVQKKHPDINLCVNYIISGIADDNKAFTKVCSEGDVSDIIKSCKFLFFQHIYSISKGQSTVDNVAYTAINKIEDFSLCTGLIRSHECTKRTSDEIGNLKSSSQENPALIPKPALVTKKNKETKEPKVEPDETSINTPKKYKSDPINQNNLPIKADSTNKNKPQKGIAGFFNKSNTVQPKNIKIENDSRSTSTIKKDEEPVVNNGMDVEKDEIKGTEKVNKEKKSNKNHVTVMKKNAKIDKKRKRLLHVSDSESEDEKDNPFADDRPLTNGIDVESEDEIPPTPALNTIKITSGIVNPKKRRKIVDKTYTDEDGYILTKKEEIYESCSENEDVDIKENIQKVNEISSKKKENNIPLNNKIDVSPNKNIGVRKKKSSPPQKGKQQTLMNFFKKV
ncbi:DNA polymerase delta subunit 3 [Achroia grisella]|uniref:DNA polymerase delta subunit 3 n=1 Tax=Achroia grisella TaxID=688607 RepID=UPI0027D249A9|nr:DNA polymerase delta subunit 3 [Achroia grisella]